MHISAGTRVLGIALLLPALVVTLVQFVVPSLFTFGGSFQSIGLRPERDFVGLSNYAAAARSVPSGLGLALATSAIAAILGALGCLVGTAAGRGGALPRRITAAVAGVMVTLYAPMGMALALRPYDDVTSQSPVLGPIVIQLLVCLPPVLAAGVLVGLLAGRPGGTRTGALAASALVGVAAAGATGLQTLTVAIAARGLARPDSTLQAAAYQLAFVNVDFGPGLAVETLVLLGVGVLGILATVVLAVSRLRLELTGPTAARGSAIGWLGLGLAALALVVVLVVHRGWLAGLVAPALPEPPPGLTTRWMINTWGPSLVLALLQVVFSGLAGFALGWLRPAGRRTGWLLLLFAPWLLLGAAPLVPQHFLTAMQFDAVGTWVTAVPPIWLSLPAMVAFSWLFGALGDAHRAARQGDTTSTTARGVVTGAAGTVLIGALLWLTAAQSLPWRYVTGTRSDELSGPVALLQIAASRGYAPVGTPELPQWVSTPIPVLAVLAVVIATTAVLTTDRLALRTGKDTDPTARPPVTDWPHGQTPQQAHASAPTAVPGRDRDGPVQD